jgi:hypothetical protein
VAVVVEAGDSAAVDDEVELIRKKEIWWSKVAFASH